VEFLGFLGSYGLRLDEKGRLVLPAKWRTELAEGLVITKGQDRCLFVYPVAEFRRVSDSLRRASTNDKRVRDYARFFFSGASDEVPDKQGRVTVPAGLRTYAGLDREVQVIGSNGHVEVWDAAAWAEFEASHEGSYAEIREEFLPALP
jgi:MraZ protein